MTTTDARHARSSDSSEGPRSLRELLDADLSFETYTSNHLSSHLPMQLIALDRLGAPAELLERSFSGYARRFAVERRDPGPLEALRAEIEHHGIDTIVAARARPLVDDPMSQWFHAMIRLAYAIDERHDGQVASALLSWEASHRAPAGSRSTAEPSPVGTNRSLDDVAAFVAAAHVAGDNFATLHALTGTQAARVLASIVDDEALAKLTAAHASAIDAAYVESGSPTMPTKAELDRLRTRDLPTWSEIDDAAVERRDAHVVKLVYSCHGEHAATHDELYRYVAARAAKLA